MPTTQVLHANKLLDRPTSLRIAYHRHYLGQDVEIGSLVGNAIAYLEIEDGCLGGRLPLVPNADHFPGYVPRISWEWRMQERHGRWLAALALVSQNNCQPEDAATTV